jgi:hypothetical protein
LYFIQFGRRILAQCRPEYAEEGTRTGTYISGIHLARPERIRQLEKSRAHLQDTRDTEDVRGIRLGKHAPALRDDENLAVAEATPLSNPQPSLNFPRNLC